VNDRQPLLPFLCSNTSSTTLRWWFEERSRVSLRNNIVIVEARRTAKHQKDIMRRTSSSVLLLSTLSVSTAFNVERKASIAVDHLKSFNRVLAASTFAILGWSGGGDINHVEIHHPPPAYALKEKNEVLCNTGFFTNVGAWYCTDIGNIGDEGQVKPLSKNDEASVDSLMSKFNFDDDSSTTEGDSAGKTDGNEESGKTNDRK
jgi:hypothetical protein